MWIHMCIHIEIYPGASFIILCKRLPWGAAAAVGIFGPGGVNPRSSSRLSAGGGYHPPPQQQAIRKGGRLNPPPSGVVCFIAGMYYSNVLFTNRLAMRDLEVLVPPKFMIFRRASF